MIFTLFHFYRDFNNTFMSLFIKINMVFVYSGVKIHYSIFGDAEGFPCLLLHGWGGSGKVFQGLIKNFPSRKFITVDFPPFGKSQKRIKDWNIFTYATMVMSLCEHLGISKCDVLGHSFGGRVAVLLSALKKGVVRSCVLVDSAGLKPKRRMDYYFRLYRYKILKKLGFYLPDAGSEDYKVLSEDMKKIFIAVVNQYLDEYCPLITAKTLIIFGKNDKETPLYMGKRFHKLIKNSRFVVLEDAGHYSFLDSPLVFYKYLEEFWEEV